MTRQPPPKSPEHRRLIRRIRITGWSALSSLLVTIIGFITWAHVVYPADRAATIEVFRSETVTVADTSRAIVISPAVATAEETLPVMVFYPGGRVDPYSYLPPLAEVATAADIRVVIAKVALNLALTDTRGVDELASLAGPYNQLSVGGHSLGGVKACLEASNPKVTHLVLLAGYCANDLSSRGDLAVMTVLGSADALTDLSLVDEASTLLPEGARQITIPGANHASFGAYGPQAGDGVATVDADEVWQSVASEITTLLSTEGDDRS